MKRARNERCLLELQRDLQSVKLLIVDVEAERPSFSGSGPWKMTLARLACSTQRLVERGAPKAGNADTRLTNATPRARRSGPIADRIGSSDPRDPEIYADGVAPSQDHASVSAEASKTRISRWGKSGFMVSAAVRIQPG